MVARLRVEMEIVAKAACEYKGVYGDKHGEEMLFWCAGFSKHLGGNVIGVEPRLARGRLRPHPPRLPTQRNNSKFLRATRELAH